MTTSLPLWDDIVLYGQSLMYYIHFATTNSETTMTKSLNKSWKFRFCSFQAKTVQQIFFVFRRNDKKRKTKDEMNLALIRFKHRNWTSQEISHTFCFCFQFLNHSNSVVKNKLIFCSAHWTLNFTNPNLQFSQFKVLQSVYFFFLI